jgi:tape measure domain-containing protein
MSVGRVGGLYVAVGADVQPALNAIKNLQIQINNVARDMQRLGNMSVGGGAGRAASAATNEMSRMGQAAAATKSHLDALARAHGGEMNAAQRMAAAHQNVATKAAATRAQIAALTGEENRSATASDKAAASQERLARSISKSGQAARSGAGNFATLARSTFGMSQAFANIQYSNPAGVLSGLLGAVTAIPAAVNPMVVGFLAAGAALGGVAIAAGAATTALGKFGTQAGGDLQMLKIRYEALLGSAERANKEVAFLQALSKESIVPTQDLADANRLLLSYGVTADGVRQNLLKFFSDFGSATGISAAKLNDMAYALGQVNAQGKANGIDLRQLANAGINLADVYKEVAKQQGVSVKEAQNFTEQGKMTADVLIPAILALGDKYQEGAAKARQSLQGIWANLGDIVTVQMGKAFQPFVKWLTKALQSVEAFLGQLDQMFAGIGAAFENLGYYLEGAFAGLEDNYATTTDFWNKTLPEALNVTVAAFGVLIRVVRTWWEAMVGIWNGVVLVVSSGATALVSAFLLIANGMNSIIQISPFVSQSVKDASAGAVAALQSVADTAAGAATSAVNQIATSSATVARIWSTPIYKTLYYRVQYTADKGDYVGTPPPGGYATPGASTPEVPEFKPPAIGGGGGGSGGGGGGGGSKVDPAIQQWKDWLAKLREIIDAALDGLKTMRDAVRRPFGELSDIQKTFRGDSIDSIIGLYDNLSEAVKKFYGPATAKWLVGSKAAKAATVKMKADLESLRKQTASVIKLIRENEELEERREALFDSQKADLEADYAKRIEAASKVLDDATSAYETANDKLSDLIDERNSFLDSIRETATSFVNALDLEQETYEQFTRIDGVGSFVTEQKQRTASFKESLETRLQTLKDWFAKIKGLQARGLDASLIQQLVNAGPESSAEAVKQLSDASDDVLAEVNTIQSELRSQIDEFSAFSSDAWFNAGIAEQQVIVDNAKAAVDAAKAVYDGLELERDQALEALEKSYDEYTDALGKQIKANEATAVEISNSVQAQFRKLTTSSYAAGLEVTKGLIDGMTENDDKVVAAAKALADKIAKIIRKSLEIQSPSKVTRYMGEMVGEGLAVGMDETTRRIEASAVRMANAAVPDVAGQSAPEVRVFIGDRELTDIIDVQMTNRDVTAANYVRSGRRL